MRAPPASAQSPLLAPLLLLLQPAPSHPDSGVTVVVAVEDRHPRQAPVRTQPTCQGHLLCRRWPEIQVRSTWATQTAAKVQSLCNSRLQVVGACRPQGGNRFPRHTVPKKSPQAWERALVWPCRDSGSVRRPKANRLPIVALLRHRCACCEETPHIASFGQQSPPMPSLERCRPRIFPRMTPTIACHHRSKRMAPNPDHDCSHRRGEPGV
mmetsp:Transcript_64420/g.142063  ORF Transcript_64420/g.142063 Transcript_64420/m.142063 type:complete len:210 (+) Transcript_64420:655-1284(+)